MASEFPNIDKDVSDLKEQRVQLLAYCASKLKSEDFHGVADAAMDLREIDAKLEVLEPMSGEN